MRSGSASPLFDAGFGLDRRRRHQNSRAASASLGRSAEKHRSPQLVPSWNTFVAKCLDIWPLPSIHWYVWVLPCLSNLSLGQIRQPFGSTKLGSPFSSRGDPLCSATPPLSSALLHSRLRTLIPVFAIFTGSFPSHTSSLLLSHRLLPHEQQQWTRASPGERA